MRFFLYGLMFLLITDFASGQATDSIEIELGRLFSELKTTSVDAEREKINNSIHASVLNYARLDSVFYHSFKTLRNIGQVTSPDSSIKIITWNLVLDNFNGKYFTVLIKRGDSQNKVYTLEAPYKVDPPADDTTYRTDNWYGALYYAIKPFTDRHNKYWAVLGLDYGDPAVTRKLIDVISFEGDSVIFGRKCFKTPGGLKYREIFEYASTGMMTLRFISDNTIVFDHLVPITATTTDNRIYYGPDYSYDAYIYNSGIWEFRLNVDVRNEN